MKEITILGMGSTMIKCSYTGEIWAMNQTYKVAKRIDKLFITDPRLNFKSEPNHNFDELNSLDIPIISLHHFSEIKNFVHYPYDEIVEEFKTDFFTDTVCYMLAYAIHEGYEKIHMYGIDMATQMEYMIERGGVEFWVGMAMGRGIEVTNTKGSMVCKPVMGVPYGQKAFVDMKTVDPYNLLKKHEEMNDAAEVVRGRGKRKKKENFNPAYA